MNKGLKYAFGLIAVIGIGAGAYFALSSDARRNAKIAVMDKVGDAAKERMVKSGASSESSVAAEFINIPIAARELAPGLFQATGVGNTQVIKTSDGNIVFDTGLSTQAGSQIKVLEPLIGKGAPSHIIVSHSHADHSGGVKIWRGPKTEIIAHHEFSEEQRYLTELQPYFWGRNRTLFPFMPETPPTMDLIAYGGIEPTQTVRNGEPKKFSHGGVDIELHALPGAEGADNLVLWLPDGKILLSGDFFGPLFPQFPNVFTMRGEKIRKPVDYINSLNTIIALDPDMIVPSHKDPITDKVAIREGLVKMRDATRFVHDETIAAMNGGQTLEQAMTSIKLPPELSLTQEHGSVAWAVKSIWEYYATWFHFDKTTELYPVPVSSVAGDLLELAGYDNLIARADAYNQSGDPLQALHILDIIAAEGKDTNRSLEARKAALTTLLKRVTSGTGNSYEIYWLNYRLRDVDAKLAAMPVSE